MQQTYIFNTYKFLSLLANFQVKETNTEFQHPQHRFPFSQALNGISTGGSVSGVPSAWV